MEFKTNYAILNAFPVTKGEGEYPTKEYQCELFGQLFTIPERAFEYLFSPKKGDTFCRREAEVTALQYTEHISTESLVEFIAPNEFITSSEPGSEGDLFIYGQGNTVVVSLYDYIVKDYLGNFKAVTPIVFQQVYKRI